MKEFYLYEIFPEVEEQLEVSQLLCVATLTKVNGKNILDTNEQPALELFNEKGIEVTSNGWVIMNGRTPIGFLEATNQGCDYRYYNHSDKSKATVIKCLVFADSSVDGIVNPGLKVENVDGLVTCTNITQINGQHWNEVSPNRTIRMKGFHFVVTRVSDGNFGSVKYLLENNGYNQLGASRNAFVKISKTPNSEADYVWSTKDQTDQDEEVLAFNFISAIKNESSYLRIPFTELFN